MHSLACFVASALGAAALLTACGAPGPYAYGAGYPGGSTVSSYPQGTYPNQQSYPNQPVTAVEYGRITNVQLVSAGTASPSSGGSGAAGSVIGGVVGGLLGHTVGRGSGRAAATVLGAVGGAVVGNNLDRSRGGGNYATTGPVYRVTVQTDTGPLRSYDVSATGDLRVGDRVRIENGVIYLA